MPTVTLNKDVFEKLVGKKLPLDKLKDRISMLGTDLEKIEGNEIVVEVFPNRPDMLSEQGFARAFSSFIGTKTGLRKYEIKKSGYEVIVDKSVSMRPYTACAIVKNIKFTDEGIREIMQMQEKLSMSHGRNRKKSEYGIYPIENVTFPVHYIAKDPKKVFFQPLGFDKKICAIDVEELHPKGREYKWIAEDWEKYPFFIDDKDNVMSMLPYTNSHDTGKVNENTKEVFIECTGTDFNNIMYALNIFVTMFSEMGGEIYSIDVVYPDKTVTTPDLTPKSMKLDLASCNKLLGLDLKEAEVKILLERMGYGYEKGDVLIPAYRADIMHQVDLFEDIAIAYGYENFVEEIPNENTVAEESFIEKFKRKVAEVLVGIGLLELNTYNLTDEALQNKMMNAEIKLVRVENSVSKEYNVLRAWMIPTLLDVLKHNKHHEYPQRIFDIGTVFKENPKMETNVEENQRLGVALCEEKADFTKAKQVLDYLMRMLDIQYKVVEAEHPSFISGRVCRVLATKDGKEWTKVAYMGEIHPSVLANFDLEMPVAVFELNITELFELKK